MEARLGGIVEFVEVVPAIFAIVTAMLVILTRLEQNLGRDRSPARVVAPARGTARRRGRPGLSRPRAASRTTEQRARTGAR